MTTFQAGETLLAADLELWVQGQCLDSLVISTIATYYSGTAEALVTSASVAGDLIAGHRYRIAFSIPVSSAAGGTGTFITKIQIRKTNLAGTLLGSKQESIVLIQGGYTAASWADYDCTGNESATFVATAQRASGATSNATVGVIAGYPLQMSLHDITAGTIPRTL